MKSGTCYIFGAGEFTSCNINLTTNDIVLAADGGYHYAKELGLPIHTVIGDFDSIDTKELPNNRIVHPTHKDDTDMRLVIQYGLEQGYQTFCIYGGLGGRLDHTLANIQDLAYISKCGANGKLFGQNYTITTITNNFIILPKKDSGYISVFSLSDTSTGVNIKNLKYPLKNATVSNTIPIGVSNQFVGKEAEISVDNGTLAILFYH